MAVPAPRATSGMECREASLAIDSTSSALSGYTEATAPPAPDASSPTACCEKRVPNFSSRISRASSGMLLFTNTVLVSIGPLGVASLSIVVPDPNSMGASQWLHEQRWPSLARIDQPVVREPTNGTGPVGITACFTVVGLVG